MLGIVFVALVAGAMAMNPKPCCLTNEFSTVMYQLGANIPMGSTEPKVNDDYVYLNFDYDNSRLSVESHRLNQTTRQREKVNIFNFYNMSKQYIATEDGHCYVKTIPSTLAMPCIPRNFSHAGSYSIGSLRSHKTVSTDTFVGMLGQKHMAYHVTSNDCTPVAQDGFGTNDDGSFSIYTWLYADVKRHYKIGSFLMPSTCDHAMDITGHGKRDLEDMYDALPLHPFV